MEAPPRDPVPVGSLHRLAPAESELSDREKSAFWESVADAFYRALPDDGGVFNLSAVEAQLEGRARLHDRCTNFRGLEAVVARLPEVIPAPADALVVAHATCDLKKVGSEILSLHAVTGEHARLVGGARDDEDGWVAQFVELTEQTLMRDVLQPGAPVFAPQPAVASYRRLRHHIIRHETSYAMRVAPDQLLNNWRRDLDERSIDEPTASYAAGTWFDHAERMRGTRPRVLEILDLGPRTRFRECLVEIPGERRAEYVLTRPWPWPVRRERDARALELSDELRKLPRTPLSHRYRCHQFHHTNARPWRMIFTLLGLADAARPIA
jgi:hypothetical protein